MVAGVAGASSRSSTVVIEEKVVLRPPPKVLSSGVFRTSQTVGVDGEPWVVGEEAGQGSTG